MALRITSRAVSSEVSSAATKISVFRNRLCEARQRMRVSLNRYGLLHGARELQLIEARRAAGLWAEYFYNKEPIQPDQRVALFTESASEWLKIFESLRQVLSRWAELAEQPISKRRKFLALEKSPLRKGELLFEVDIDPQTEQPFSQFIASSLADLLWVQCGLSIAAQVGHRQCAQCDKFFEVHPGSGRSDKRFCSVACRMRGYRMRKSAVS
jgi:hypothetical protein